MICIYRCIIPYTYMESYICIYILPVLAALAFAAPTFVPGDGRSWNSNLGKSI